MNFKLSAFFLVAALTLVDAGESNIDIDPFHLEGARRLQSDPFRTAYNRARQHFDGHDFEDDNEGWPGNRQRNRNESNNRSSLNGNNERFDRPSFNNYDSDSSGSENTRDTFKNWLNKPLFTTNSYEYYRPSRLVANILIFLAVVVVISVIASFVAARKP